MTTNVRIRFDYREWYTGHLGLLDYINWGVEDRVSDLVDELAYDPVWVRVFSDVRSVMMAYCEEQEL